MFENANITLIESSGTTSVKVIRKKGAHGRVGLDYIVHEETAKNGTDFEISSTLLEFANNEVCIILYQKCVCSISNLYLKKMVSMQLLCFRRKKLFRFKYWTTPKYI